MGAEVATRLRLVVIETISVLRLGYLRHPKAPLPSTFRLSSTIIVVHVLYEHCGTSLQHAHLYSTV
jgi:hypothetical protein